MSTSVTEFEFVSDWMKDEWRVDISLQTQEVRVEGLVG